MIVFLLSIFIREPIFNLCEKVELIFNCLLFSMIIDRIEWNNLELGTYDCSFDNYRCWASGVEGIDAWWHLSSCILSPSINTQRTFIRDKSRIRIYVLDCSYGKICDLSSDSLSKSSRRCVLFFNLHFDKSFFEKISTMSVLHWLMNIVEKILNRFNAYEILHHLFDDEIFHCCTQ